MDYIIVQAGGRGTRLGHLTKNKPKALAPIDNLPMLFHLFRQYQDKRFVIIADYKKDVMRRYLAAFAEVKYQVVDANGSGTCGGIHQALNLLPEHEPFMLVWSDLILPDHFVLPEGYDGCGVAKHNYVGLSQSFTCRWRYEDGRFSERRSDEYGVAGFFLFTEKRALEGIPANGELVKWIGGQSIDFKTIGLAGTREFGVLEEYNNLGEMKCRPFNKITVEGEVFIKEPVDTQGEILAKREAAWYENARYLNIPQLPEVYETSPLKMEYIHGKNIYECDFDYDTKKKILKTIVEALHSLHESKQVKADTFSIQEAYFKKTMDRLFKIQQLVPLGMEKEIRINGRVCRNVFYYWEELEKRLDRLKENCESFSFIHGDNTFSNLMIRENNSPVLIDPRGYFGFTDLYGDVRYDWAKLYYSIVGNYDQFNLKKFQLDIGANADEGVSLKIESSHWENLEKDFFELTRAEEYEIKLLHAVIWLSLTTYAWQDYDSICGAFYNGLYYLEEVL